MLIRGWRVDGYGVFRDFEVDDLGAGLTVLVGPNEAGKSTLLAFLRGVLFGFPDGRHRDAAVRPLRGGRHGGVVDLETSSGRATVGRWSEPRPSLRVRLADGTEGGEALLTRVTGGVDARVYQAVFSCGIDELTELRGLAPREARERILTAGITAVAREAEGLRRRLDAELATLLKVRGSSPITDLTAALQDNRSHLLRARNAVAIRGERMREEDALRNSIGALAEEAARLEQERAAIETLLELGPLRCERERLLAESRSLEHVAGGDPPPADAEPRLAELGERMRAANVVLQRARAALVAGERRRRTLEKHLDPRLRALGAEILRVAVSALERADRLRELESAREIEADLLRVFRRAVGGVGGEEHLARAGRREDLRRRKVDVRRHGQILAHAFADLERAESELAIVSGQAAASASDGQRASADSDVTPAGAAAIAVRPPRRSPPLLSWISAAMGLAALVVGAGDSGGLPVPLVVLLGAACGAGVGAELLRLAARRRTTTRARNALERARNVAEAATRRWADWKRAEGLPEALTTSRALEFVDGVSEALRARGELVRARKRRRALEGRDRRWVRRARELLRRSGRSTGAVPEGELPTRLAELARAVRSDTVARRRSAALERALQERREEMNTAARERDDAARSRALLLESCGARDESDLRARVEARRCRERFVERAEELEARVESTLQSSGQAVELRRALEAGDEAKWEERKRDLHQRLREVAAERDATIRCHRDAEAARLDLEGSTDLAALEQEREELQAELDALTRRWRVAAVARALLDRSLEKLRVRRQPRVLEEASALLRRVTAGRHVSIQAADSERDLVVVSGQGERRHVRELSRGTREQLYLSLRLALVGELARDGVRLPVVLDDVLVNLDPERAEAMASALVEVARSHQVLMFTCHPHVGAMVSRLAAGAEVRELPGAPEGDAPNTSVGGTLSTSERRSSFLIAGSYPSEEHAKNSG